MVVELEVLEDHAIDLEVDNAEAYDFPVDAKESGYSIYTGTYEVTPSAEAQALPSKDSVLLQNIIINPIPQNYGLITWNGSTLTVS